MPRKPQYRGLTVRKLADRSEGERIPGLLVPATAVTADPDNPNLVFVNPAGSEKILFNPATPVVEHEPWPLAGIRVEGDPPKHLRVPLSTVQQWRRESLLTVEGARYVIRTGGPPEQPDQVLHHFLHADTLVLHTVDGNLRWRVVENPDKWPDEKTAAPDPGFPAEDCGFGGEVRWYFDCELEK